MFEELRSIVEYNFQLIKMAPGIKPCVTPRELAYRLWNNFRWRGYIHPEVNYRVPDFTDNVAVQKDLQLQLGAARGRGLKSPEAMKKAKEKFNRDILKTLSPELFDTILKKYKSDFEMFAYENKRAKYIKFMLNIWLYLLGHENKHSIDRLLT